jgi:LysM repeat protein
MVVGTGKRAEPLEVSVRAVRTVSAVLGVLVLAGGSQLAASDYVVRSGETLSGIAARAGVDARALASTNGIRDPNRVYAGQRLRLPGSGPATSAPGRYLVRRGDTLSSIASSQRVSVSALVAANGIRDVHRIFAGTWLQLPGGSSTSSAAPSGSTTYRVKAGDNLTTIARRFGLSAATLAGANNVRDPNLVVVGRSLVIPATGAGSAAVEYGGNGTLPARLRAHPERLALMGTFDRWAAANGIPADLLKAMAWMESGWQNSVVSSTGAVGIGQLMPDTTRFVRSQLIGVPTLDPRVPADNIRMSARFLRYLLASTGDTRAALGAYYQGLRSIRERGMYPETVAYVAGIQALRRLF